MGVIRGVLQHGDWTRFSSIVFRLRMIILAHLPHVPEKYYQEIVL